MSELKGVILTHSSEEYWKQRCESINEHSVFANRISFPSVSSSL